jgi:salicylate hydroxylase
LPAKRVRVAIVGAGVAGAILARRLARLPDVELVCIERAAQGEHDGSGTGLNIGPNAVLSLTALDPALATDVNAASLPWRNWRKSMADGRTLFEAQLAEFADCDGWRIRWSDLYRTLREGCGPAISYGCELADVGADPDAPGKSRIAWCDTDGEHQLGEIDLLVGADGRYSRVRKAISGPPVVRQLGVAVFRLLVPDTSGGLIDDHEQWFNGPNRLLAFRLRPDHVYIAGTFPIPADVPIGDVMKTAAFLRDAYAPAGGGCDAVDWLVDAACTHASEAHWARMQEQDVLFGQSDPAVLYLGDSAHGMVPTLGQGATQAIEDACYAARWMEEAITNGRRDILDWPAAIDVGRRERIEFVMDFSRTASAPILAGGDPLAGLPSCNRSAFVALLSRLYRDVPPVRCPGGAASKARAVAA